MMVPSAGTIRRVHGRIQACFQCTSSLLGGVAEVEGQGRASLLAEPRALGGRRCSVDGATLEDDAVVAKRDLPGDEVAEDVSEHELRIAVERVTPPTGARGPEDERVACV